MYFVEVYNYLQVIIESTLRLIYLNKAFNTSANEQITEINSQPLFAENNKIEKRCVPHAPWVYTRMHNPNTWLYRA